MKIAKTKGGQRVEKVLTGVETVGYARKEKNLQKWLDMAVVAIALGTIALGKLFESGKRELAAAKKLEAERKRLKLQGVSNYDALQKLYDTELKDISAEQLAEEFAAEADKKKMQFVFTKPTPAQEAVIDRYYGLKAERTMEIIHQIAAFLALKNPKGVPNHNEEPAQAETAQAPTVNA